MKSFLLSVFSIGLVCFFHSGCAQANEAAAVPGNVVVREAFPKLSFKRPVDFQSTPDNRIFVVEQRGVISVFPNDSQVTEKDTFLDIEGRVEDDGNEEGLLGLAFHPDFQDNGYFYVNYTASRPDRTVISRFRVSDTNPDQADPDSEQVILEFEQPYSNHNGGQLGFGPDGYLYIAVGDGGSGGDPKENGQDLKTLLGTILRIDVNGSQVNMRYGIPADNPFAENKHGYRQEIWAYGLRNPWRFSFDTENGQLWTADVGQNKYEEINIIEPGGNYGWNTMEGLHCFDPSSGCEEEGLILPVFEYGRNEGVSVTGGFVYRGPSLKKLQGKYIYADFVTARIWSLDLSDKGNPVNTELLKANFPVSSFGTDQKGELYICGFDGKIYTLAIQQ